MIGQQGTNEQFLLTLILDYLAQGPQGPITSTFIGHLLFHGSAAVPLNSYVLLSLDFDFLLDVTSWINKVKNMKSVVSRANQNISNPRQSSILGFHVHEVRR